MSVLQVMIPENVDVDEWIKAGESTEDLKHHVGSVWWNRWFFVSGIQ